ncbi:rhodanese-like domain-containing protein [Chitinivibrio alkaliphilus]|nr:rhodanese-like domain-containing protein [Chitinivibrio alkaliphilus]
MRFLLLCILCLFFVACGNIHRDEALTEDEILTYLSRVVGADNILEDYAMEYFDNLSSESNNLITPETLQKRIDNGDDIFILDIRRSSDYEESHIYGAENIWWFDIGRHLDQLPRDREIVVACYSGQSAGQVLGVLYLLGYEVLSLRGGMNNGWITADMPLHTPRSR